MSVDKERLIRCLNPQSIAVIGGREAEEVLWQTQKLGYQGEIWALNPRRESMAGIPCLPDISCLPKTPDAVFVGVPAEATIDIVRQLNEMGVGGAVCLASGFKEVGDDGKDRQGRLIAAAGDMPFPRPELLWLY